jgi:hypothetical protein
VVIDPTEGQLAPDLTAAFAGRADIRRIVLSARTSSFFIYLSVVTGVKFVTSLSNIFIRPVYK